MALERLLQGFADFRLGYYREHLDLFEKLATEGQSPKILIIGCADARVDPGILTQTKPGDIFTVRNVAAMVPPASIPPDQRHHGTSAAIEFAVRGLECRACRGVWVMRCAAASPRWSTVASSAYADYDYLATWTSIAQERARPRGRGSSTVGSRDEIVRAVEQAAVVNSVANLMGFPLDRRAGRRRHAAAARLVVQPDRGPALCFQSVARPVRAGAGQCSVDAGR